MYEGETSRTLYTRASQHTDDYTSNLPGRKVKGKASWMWNHVGERHGGRGSSNPEKDIQFRLMGKFRDCLSRQLDEAVRLEMIEKHGRVLGDRGERRGGKVVEILNSRGEYFQPKIVQHTFHQL